MIPTRDPPESTAMLPFDPARTDLLQAFCAQPFGPFPPELEPFARWVYFQPGPGRWVLVTLERHVRWQLAWYAGRRGESLTLIDGAVFDSIAAGSAAIARRRWAEEVTPVGGDPRAVAAASHARVRAGTPLAVSPKRIVGYCEPWSLTPGDTLAVKVSAWGAAEYTSRVRRIVSGDDLPGGAGLDLRDVPELPARRHPAREQRHPIGSYLRVDSLPVATAALTFACVFSPWLPGAGRQTLAATRTPAGGWSLALDERGRLELRVVTASGVHALVHPRRPARRAWYRAVARVDAAAGCLELRLERLPRPVGVDLGAVAEPGPAVVWSPFDPCPAGGPGAADGRLRAGAALHLGALPDPAGGRWIAEVYEGRLERPRLAHAWLDDATLTALQAHEPPAAALAACAGAWDLAREPQGDVAIDLGPHAHHGRFVNLPTRGVQGADWTGEVHDPRARPHEYAAVHFHSDDLYDAGWDTDFELTIPANLPSGCYAIELGCADDRSWLTFYVRPPRDSAIAPLAFLASTATYLSYANYRFALDDALSSSQLGYPVVLEREHVHHQLHPELGLSHYDRHRDGSGVHYATRRRPVLNHGPCTDVWNFNADTHLLAWLAHTGQAVDVITDEDLDAEGAALLQRYRCVLTGSHPEYWSTRMWRGLEEYLGGGGRLLYLGGNGFYWRAAFDAAFPGALELRRGQTGARYWSDEPGEDRLAFTGEPGGLWRTLGCPPETLVGVATRAIGFEASAPYEPTAAARDPRVAFLFEGLDAAQPFGAEGLVGGGAAGSEMDASDRDRGTPAHALVVAVARALPPSAQPVPEDITMCHRAQGARLDPAVRAEIVFFETPRGGAVLSVGSVAFVSALPVRGYDNDVARFTGNALRRFLDPAPLPPPPADAR